MARLRDDFVRHAGELRDLQAVAAVGRAFLHRVQKHDPVAMLGRIQVHVGAALDLLRERRELEIMGREQREGAQARGDVARDRPGERQAIEGARAAADLIHENEACGLALCRMLAASVISTMKVERPPAQIIGGADAREDAIQRAR